MELDARTQDAIDRLADAESELWITEIRLNEVDRVPVRRARVRKLAAIRRLRGHAYICPRCHSLEGYSCATSPAQTARTGRVQWLVCGACDATYGHRY